MFSWLKKRCNKQQTPVFSRYYTTRNAWVSDDSDYGYICQKQQPAVTVPDHHADTEEFKNTFDDPADHTYAEIDEVAVSSCAIDQLAEAISCLTLKIELDFGEKEENNVSEDDRDETEGDTISTRSTTADLCEPIYTEINAKSSTPRENKCPDSDTSPRTRRCREKCQLWLINQASHISRRHQANDIPEWSSSEDIPSTTTTRRRHPTRVIKRSRRMSINTRRQMLKRIEESWFDTSCDSSDFSEESTAATNWSACSSQQYVVIKYVKEPTPSTASSSEETSGFYEDNHHDFTSSPSLPKSDLSSDKNNMSSDSLFSKKNDSATCYSKEEEEILPSFNPKIGFGLNKWYIH
ncbi:hypothetical protein SNE40_016545 [Patella caerulea]|uniref:Uncharacterized protein n=1 Tax=Patella caerulea TaxID=87958 RepID=A0AAN8JEF4_PATCE